MKFFFGSRVSFFLLSSPEKKKPRKKKDQKRTHPALAGARLAAVDDVLHREVGHGKGAGAAADVVAVGERGGRGCFLFKFFFLSLEVRAPGSLSFRSLSFFLLSLSSP